MAKARVLQPRFLTLLLGLSLLLATAQPALAWLAPPEQYHVDEGWPEQDPINLTEQEPADAQQDLANVADHPPVGIDPRVRPLDVLLRAILEALGVRTE